MQQAHARSNSPCIKVCNIVDGYCNGCHRTIYEITNWTRYTDNERIIILKELEKRNGRNLG